MVDEYSNPSSDIECHEEPYVNDNSVDQDVNDVVDIESESVVFDKQSNFNKLKDDIELNGCKTEIVDDTDLKTIGKCDNIDDMSDEKTIESPDCNEESSILVGQDTDDIKNSSDKVQSEYNSMNDVDQWQINCPEQSKYDDIDIDDGTEIKSEEFLNNVSTYDDLTPQSNEASCELKEVSYSVIPPDERSAPLFDKYKDSRFGENLEDGFRVDDYGQLLLDEYAIRYKGLGAVGIMPCPNPDCRNTRPKFENMCSDDIRSNRRKVVLGSGMQKDNRTLVLEAKYGPHDIISMTEASNYEQAIASVASMWEWSQNDVKELIKVSGKDVDQRQTFIDHICQEYDMSQDDAERMTVNGLTIHEQFSERNGKRIPLGVIVPRDLHESISHKGANYELRKNMESNEDSLIKVIPKKRRL